MKIRSEIFEIPGAPLEGVNPLPSFRKRGPTSAGTTERFPAKLKETLGCDNKVLPYLMQDRYSRKRLPLKLKSFVLENKYLKARFLPEYGGRLHSLFDKENGFQLIDLDQKTGGFGKEKFTVDEYVDDLFGGTFDAAIAHFEDIGDQTSIGLFEQLKKRFSSIGETIAHNIDNSVDGHSTQFQNSGEQIADDIINGYETRIKDLEIQLRSE